MHRIRTGIFLLAMGTLMFLSSAGLSGQELPGTWIDSQYQVKMMLFPNSTYFLQHPNGTSSGRYGVNGNYFWMQDNAGGNPIWYMIVQFDQNTLVLQDANNMYLNYKKQEEAQDPSSSNQAQIPSPASQSKILAQAQGRSLTSDHIQTGVDLIQFIIGQPITPQEKKELEAQSIMEFKQDPTYFIQEVTSLAGSMNTIRSFTDPVRIGLTRQELFSALYQATASMPESDKPLLIQIMNRYIKVQAFDPANKLVLTDKDLEGMLQYLALNSELMGQPVQITDTLRRSFYSELAAQFATLPLEQKQLLCSGSLLWQLLEANWNSMTMMQKEQYRNAYQAQIAPSYQTYPSSPTYSQSSKSTTDMMRDYNARQSMYSMMNDMNMNSHALSLNIIENIGGTGNYWNVVDY